MMKRKAGKNNVELCICLPHAGHKININQFSLAIECGNVFGGDYKGRI